MNASQDDVILHLCETILVTFSVTVALQVLCEVRGIGTGDLRSEFGPSSGKTPLPPEGAAQLLPREGEEIKHRAITLVRGDVPLLDADNWYTPERLPQRARELLETTDTPFGAALAGSLQNRKTISAHLPPHIMEHFGGRTRVGTTAMGADEGVPIMTIRGIVTIDSVPVSFVEERFRPELIEAMMEKLNA